MKSISILVVLYNKTFDLSKTLYGLKNSVFLNNQDDFNIVVWNNGPVLLENEELRSFFEKLSNNVTLVQTLDNISLATIYNRFIKESTAEIYVILDHDSELNDFYLKDVFELRAVNFDIALPRIYFSGKQQFPLVNGFVDERESANFNNGEYISSISSGVVISRKYVDRFITHYNYMFDERFRLYGIDTVFFHQVHELNEKTDFYYINGFEHSISRLENESVVVKSFRKREMSIAYGLFLKFYKSRVKSFLYLILVLFNPRLSIFLTLKSYLLGRYFR